MSDKLKDFKAEIWKCFKDYPHVFLGTQEDDQPRIRPVTLVDFNQKLWVLTGTRSAKVRQLRENPKVEFSLLFNEGMHQGYIRAAASAKIITDKETKTRVAEQCGFFSNHWKSFDDPNYTLLELELNEIEYLRPKESAVRKFKL
jgi:general stress protein 26